MVVQKNYTVGMYMDVYILHIQYIHLFAYL